MKKRYGSKHVFLPLVSLAFFALIALWVIYGVRDASETSRREGIEMAERAVRQSAVGCYALEGAYPPSYESLREKTGLAVDETRYIVHYEIFASNIMPEITVVERRGDA